MFYCCLFHCFSFYCFPTHISLILLFLLFPSPLSRPVNCFFSCGLWLWCLSPPGLQAVLLISFNSVISVFLCAPLPAYVFTYFSVHPYQPMFSLKHLKFYAKSLKFFQPLHLECKVAGRGDILCRCPYRLPASGEPGLKRSLLWTSAEPGPSVCTRFTC